MFLALNLTVRNQKTPARNYPIDVIVIGGGVAGLAAARQLSRSRLRVTLLEARRRLGGRIDTLRPRHWPLPVELGAEFVHGGNPELWRVLRRARVQTRRVTERHWVKRGDAIKKVRDLDRRIAGVTGLISPRRAAGLSFAEYFRRHPANVPSEDWILACNFVEGFEAAPLDRISARSLAGEDMEERHQYSLPGGYDQVVAALAADCSRHGARLHRNAVVRRIRWRRGRVEVTATLPPANSKKTFVARAVIVTLPLGVLKARTGRGAVRFHPRLKQKQGCIDRMEVGHALRLALRFEERRWRRLLPKAIGGPRRDGFGFLHSQGKGMPVWWSLSDKPVVVGWAGGPAAKALLKLSAAARRRLAIRSLAEILDLPPQKLGKAVLACQGRDWTHDPFSRGAYSFVVAGNDGGGAKLRSSIQRTIFFAGEATADGAEIGTVHGALRSGIRAAKEAKRALAQGRVRGRKPLPGNRRSSGNRIESKASPAFALGL